MRLILKATLLASTIALLPLSVAAPASARAAVTIDFGNIAVGYRDGYWDNGHHWHKWSSAQEAKRYRTQYHDNYHDMNHDHAPNKGWRDR